MSLFLPFLLIFSYFLAKKMQLDYCRWLLPHTGLVTLGRDEPQKTRVLIFPHPFTGPFN